ncbi:MAG: iron ABC transporter permease, partial [Candidatus Bathyarchaeota archaeon]|nr:iron ABC transporter permease [Candidatus Bathyarchaeota archaeon]
MSTAAELKRLYKKGRKRKALAILVLTITLVIAIVISVSVGAGSPRFNEAMQVISAKLLPFLNMDPGARLTQTIILDLRLPRIVLALIAGAGLAASGATMQGVLRNPLVSSYILGISAAAGFGAALAITFGIGLISGYGSYLVIVNAFVFSMLAMLLVYGIARIRSMTTETVILAGVAVGYLFSAMLSLIQYLAPEHEAVRAVVFWLMGGLNSATWQNILIVLPIVVLTAVLMLQQSWNINVLSMGEEVATSLGVNSKRVLAVTMVLETLATAVIIAFTGVIGFVCLISPHIARMLIGSDHRFLIPCSAFVGACLLVCSDTVGRLVLAPAELPVGIVTSLLGVPFFIYILVSRRRQSWR